MPVVLALTLSLMQAPAAAPRTPSITITDVTVLSMVPGEAPMPHRTVIIAAGRILRIAAPGAARIPTGAHLVDGHGKFLLPGLADMHVHLSTSEEFPMFIGNGVLTVRDLNGSPEILAWRDSIARGTLTGPRLFVSGPMLADSVPWRNKATPHTAEEAIATVKAQKAAGYDQIKIYDGISAPVTRAAITAARQLGMPSSGHIPLSVGFDSILTYGMDGFEHLDKIVYQAFGHTFDTLKIPEVAARIRASGMWVTPTLESMVQLAKIGSGRFDSLMARPEALASPAATREFWTTVSVRLKGNRTYPPELPYGPWTAMQFRLAHALAEAGVPMMSGTDLPNAVLVPGYSLLRELDVMVEAGIPRIKVLEATTSAPARFMRQASSWGTVAQGAEATLLLVDGDPRESFSVLANPAGVVLRDSFLDRKTLAAMRHASNAGHL
jgi:imidazolonepropionase-like amidohydrolase